MIRILLKQFSSTRVAVTGMGAVTPLGVTLAESYACMKNRQSGISDLSLTQIASFLPKDIYFGGICPAHFDGSHHKTVGSDSKLNRMHLAAVSEAILESRLNNEVYDPYRIVPF